MNWKLVEDKSWCSLEQQFEWVREMNTVQQDIRYHAEGSVAEHTPYGVGGIAAVFRLSFSFYFGERNHLDICLVA